MDMDKDQPPVLHLNTSTGGIEVTIDSDFLAKLDNEQLKELANTLPIKELSEEYFNRTGFRPDANYFNYTREDADRREEWLRQHPEELEKIMEEYGSEQ